MAQVLQHDVGPFKQCVELVARGVDVECRAALRVVHQREVRGSLHACFTVDVGTATSVHVQAPEVLELGHLRAERAEHRTRERYREHMAGFEHPQPAQ